MDGKMDKKNKIIKHIGDFGTAASGVLSIVSPPLATLPIIIHVINRTIGLEDNDIIKERIKKFEKNLLKKKYSVNDFRKKVSKLSEHKLFFSYSSLEYIFKNCIPETVDIYMEIIIDYIMKEKIGIEEELCEIISKLNVHDLLLLQKIKECLNDDEHLKYKEEMEKIEKKQFENKKEKGDNSNNLIRFVDRNIILDNNMTIFWTDFLKYMGVEFETELACTMFIESYEISDANDYCDWMFWGKSFLKLSQNGILQLDYVTTPGTINNLNIDRFHITIIGAALLHYI